MRSYLLFLPSTLLGVVGLVVLHFRPLVLAPRGGIAFALGAAFVLAALFFGLAWGLERSLPSFRYASRLLERALAGVRMTWLLALY